MNARKPNLLHILLGVVRQAEKVLAKKCPSLIDGNSVAHDIEVRIVGKRCKWEVNCVVDPPTHRADGIPNAYETWLGILREGFLEFTCNGEVDFSVLNHSNGKRN